MLIHADTTTMPTGERDRVAAIRTPLLWGAVWGVIQAASPLGFWWLDPATRQGRTVLLISHRYNTVRDADHIYVLDDGRIIEHGNHEQLMTTGGVYAELFTLQAAAYTDRAAPNGHQAADNTRARLQPPPATA
jgi:ABC-type transport system involved in Fe-S cluster assembly fused permease/ATPase subunit